MLIRRFFLKHKKCAVCGEKFEDKNIFFKSIDKGECFCHDCKCEEFDQDCRDGNRKYLPYIACNDVAHLIIMDEKILSELEDGIHGISYNDDIDGEEFFYYERRRHDIDDLKIYVRDALRWGFVLEKTSDFSCLFFNNSWVCDEKKFSLMEFTGAWNFTNNVCKMLGRKESDLNLLLNSNNDIVGIITKGASPDNSQVASVRFEEALTVKAMCDESSSEETEKNDASNESDEADTSEKNAKDEAQNDIPSRVAGALKKLTPQEMLRICEDRICGQGIQLKKAVYLIYSYLQSVASGEDFQADNWILTSPSGTGKTEFYRAIRDILKKYDIPVPVVQIDLSQITETGFKGADVVSIPTRIASENTETRGIAICFLDEADKKFVPSYSSKGVDYNAATQSNLLTLLEGMEQKVEVDDMEISFDSSKTMFVLLGSFQKLRDEKQEKSLSRGRIGFGDDYGDRDEAAVSSEAMYEELEIDDMIKFGMQEELAGRITYVVNFHKLSEDDMRDLIKKKAGEISKTMGVELLLAENAVEDFLKVSFGNMGVRTPMNQMKKLIQETIAEVFFESGFDAKKQRIVIDSGDRAHVEKISAGVGHMFWKSKEREFSK